MAKYKICTKCQIKKLFSDFRNKKATRDGKRTECKDCQDLYQKKYATRNKKKISQTKKLYRQKNSSKIKRNQKEHYLKNPKKYIEYRQKRKTIHSEYMKEYRQKNKKRILKQTRNWKKNNKEKLRINHQYKYKNDIEYRLTLLLRSRMKHALNGKLKISTTKELLGCTLSEFKKHIENQFAEGMSWENYGRYGWHIDHIKPCASFDLSKPEDQKICFHYTNLQPLWAKDNLTKHCKIL
jgi:hypothetical protein